MSQNTHAGEAAARRTHALLIARFLEVRGGRPMSLRSTIAGSRAL
jgi:hypothetical protein